ncbi:SusC/RagA family TonB-linked outer membrane protein [Prevotella histicola]|jgi:tonB-linked outer membrane protein, susC/ragA family|uniref:SusC/RagA family TonB-linked outer membrane protein n=1 Tax=Prevotella histicola TaxID=470565 RepID=UPI001CADC953|nr:TonB-dependent receptor [Prevotella histicola]MBF1418102.1 TonB-dependent receptor [Prevotella histicola]
MEKRLMMFLAALFLCVGTALAQTEISGTVISSEDKQPVVGASILVVGTQMGTVTDIDGNFHLTVPEGKTQLRIQYVGLQTQTVPAKDGMKVTLKPEAGSLDEVIVTGYGNFKKSSFTGAAANVDPGKLADVPVASVQDKLAGSVPGVTVTSASGAPGSVSNIRIRGMGSINAGNDPLYVIDGTPMLSGDINGFGQGNYNEAGTNALATLNSNDIESITVIKDAAAASLYGSRAANGVIVITTKSGKKGKTHVDFRSDWGFSNLAIDYRPVLGGDARRSLLYKGLKNYALYGEGKSEADAITFADDNIDDFAKKPVVGYDASGKAINAWTDWKKLLIKTGHHQNYQVSLSGGNDNTQFYTSLSYMKQTGIFANQGMERFTGNANLTHKFGRFVLTYSSLFTKMNQSLTSDGGASYGNPIANYAFMQSPSSIAYLPDGSFASGPETNSIVSVNPIYEALHTYDKTDIKRAFNTLKLDWNIWDALHLSEKVTYDYTSNNEDVLWDRYSNDGGPAGNAQRYNGSISQLNGQTQLSYAKNFGLHNIDALLGYETEKYIVKYNYLNGSDYPGNLYEFSNAGTTRASSDSRGYTLASWLGRVNYNYDNKYYAGVSFRRDGSSRLAEENRWGNFWSLSAAWRFGAEKFMDPVKKVLSDGKLRLSYGVNGTLPGNYYDYMSLYKYGQYYNGKSGMAIVGIANPNLKWEKNRAFNVGLDLTFIDRISVTFDYYVRTTSDLIYDLPMSAVPGYYDGSSTATTSPINVGSLRNNGYEVTIQSNNIQKKDFSWTTMLNFGHNHNKLTKIYGDENQIISGVRIHKVGEPYYSFYGFEYAGVDPATGKELFYINDGTSNARNTTTDPNKANKVIIGNHETKLEGGFTNNITWKFIDFGLNFTFSLGGKAYDAASWQHDNGDYTFGGQVPAYYDVNKMWKGPGDTSASQPVFQYGNTSQTSSRWLMPTDYLRLKSLTLGFTAPTLWVSHLGLSKARAFFSASNLLTWKSKDLYVDPEMRVDGVCTFQTPGLRTFTFGIELGF